MKRITREEMYDLDYTKNPYLELCVTLDKLAEKQDKNIIYAEIPFIEDVFFKIKRPGKYIFYAETREEALEINKKVKEVLAEANKNQKKFANKKGEKRKKLYLKTKIIQGGEDVKLSIKPSYTVETYKKEQAVEILENGIKALKESISLYTSMYKKEPTKENPSTISVAGRWAIDDLKEEVKWYRKLIIKIENMQDVTKIKIAWKSGNLWRLTYWSSEENRRKQMAFGDVIIFWGVPETNISMQSMQKKRTDTRNKSAGYIDTHPGGYFIVNKA